MLVARIFDAKIAGVTAVLMLFCEMMWSFSLSGLPQMLMLLLFSSGLYFAYRATEAAVEGQVPMLPALVAAVFFTLLALDPLDLHLDRVRLHRLCGDRVPAARSDRGGGARASWCSAWSSR